MPWEYGDGTITPSVVGIPSVQLIGGVVTTFPAGVILVLPGVHDAGGVVITLPDGVVVEVHPTGGGVITACGTDELLQMK